MVKKEVWLTSSNEEIWSNCEIYPDRQSAIEASKNNGDEYIGRLSTPKFKVCVMDFIQGIQQFNEDQFIDVDSCHRWPNPTRKQENELSDLLAQVFSDWLARHKLEPRWFIVENIEHVTHHDVEDLSNGEGEETEEATSYEGRQGSRMQVMC